MMGFDARRLAFDILLRVQTAHGFASDLLHASLERRRAAPISEDAALATELTMGVLRWQRRLDHELEPHLSGKKLDPPVHIALRLGAYQILFLDRIPAHAAVNESVELTKRAGKRSAAGLVNAVLRKLLARRAERVQSIIPERTATAERLAIHYSHPTWLVDRWLKKFGEDLTCALLQANNQAPRPCVAILGSAPAPRNATAETNSTAEGPLAPAEWLRSAAYVRSSRVELRALLEGEGAAGELAYQDEASQMVAHLLDVQMGARVLDLCAAPGGKTLILASRAGSIVASDLHRHRVSAMRERFVRARGHVPIQVLALDAAQPLPFSAQFDRVLVDVPCSGTGTLARNPEIRWRLTPEDLLDLQARQSAILTNALDALAPGGRLVYSTCSLEPEENEQVVEPVLALRPGYQLVDARAMLQGHLREAADVNQLFDSRGYFRTVPPTHHTDGFFAAVVEKRV